MTELAIAFPIAEDSTTITSYKVVIAIFILTPNSKNVVTYK